MARYIVAAHLVVFGLLYWLGSTERYASDSFTVIKALGVPVWLWGLMCVVAGMLLFGGLLIAGHALGAVLLLFWGIALTVATVRSGASAPVGPVHCLALAALHLWALNRRVRQKAGAGG